MKNTILALAVMLLFFGCDSPVQPNEDVRIRIENASGFDMDSVLVAYPEEEVFYGSVIFGEKSDYHTVSKAYRYAYVEAKIQGEFSKLQPIDYMGESFLEPGSYTYILQVHASNEDQDSSATNLNLSLELRED